MQLSAMQFFEAKERSVTDRLVPHTMHKITLASRRRGTLLLRRFTPRKDGGTIQRKF